MTKKLIKDEISRKEMPGGYLLIKRLFTDAGLEPYEMESAFNQDGVYIGSPKFAEYLCVGLGIAPEPASPDDTVCCIGFSEKEQKWFGWSHRAIFGFKAGDSVTKEHAGYTPEKGEWTAKSLDEAKQIAIDFAEGVS